MCQNPWALPTQLEANARLLSKWKRGNWKWGRTEWCAQHRAFHLMRGPGESRA